MASDFNHISYQKEAKGPDSDTTIPPHVKQVTSNDITTSMHGHATYLSMVIARDFDKKIDKNLKASIPKHGHK